MRNLFAVPFLIAVSLSVSVCVAQDKDADCKKLKEEFDTPSAFDIHTDDKVKASVPKEEIIKGVRLDDPRDAIPPIYDPKFESIKQADPHYKAKDRMLVFEHDDVARAYPHRVLTHHEICNDEISDLSFMVIY